MSKQQRRPAKVLRASRQQRRSRNASGVMSEPKSGGLVLYKSPRVVMPATYTTKLRYLLNTVLTGVGNTQASNQYRSEAYDVDPAFASTAMPGFTEMAAIYQRYRTLRLSYKFTCANQEAFPVTIIHGFSAISISAASLNYQYAGNPLFSTAILGPLTGQCRGIFRKSAAVTQIVGTKQPLYDDLYTGSTTSATLPSAGTVYCYIGAFSPIALTAAGIYCGIEVTLDVQFYRSRLLLT